MLGRVAEVFVCVHGFPAVSLAWGWGKTKWVLVDRVPGPQGYVPVLGVRPSGGCLG